MSLKKFFAPLFFAALVAGCGGGSGSGSGSAGDSSAASQDAQLSASDGTSGKSVLIAPRLERGCGNGATNWPKCTTCPAGSTMVGGVCTPTPPPSCSNGATDYPTCVVCPAGQTLVGGVCTTSTGAVGPYGLDSSAWAMTFSDEFEGTSLDTTKWNTGLWYAPGDPTINYAVENGSLKIWPQRNSSGQFFDRHLDTDGGKFSQTYGFFEIEAKLPYGKGPWPAFWLYAHPCESGTKCRPEADIMEAYPGGGPDSGWSDSNLHANNYGMTLHMANADYSYHVVAYATKLRDFSPYNTSPVDLSAGFHKYGMKWEPSGITFYFDGKQVGSKYNDSTSYYNQPMYVLLSLQFGSASGTPDSTTPTGKTNSYEIKYVRVWKAK